MELFLGLGHDSAVRNAGLAWVELLFWSLAQEQLDGVMHSVIPALCSLSVGPSEAWGHRWAT